MSNENADVTDVMNSNRKFDVWLDGTLLSHTTNQNAFIITSVAWICRVRALKERKYQLPLALFDGRHRFLLLMFPVISVLDHVSYLYTPAQVVRFFAFSRFYSGKRL